MKKMIINAVVMATLFVSCKKEQSVQPPTIVGKWNHTKDYVKLYDGIDSLIDNDTLDYTGSNEYILFNQDKSGVSYQKDVVDGNDYTTTNFTYLLDGSNLTVTADSVSSTASVTKLTNNELVLHVVNTDHSYKDVIDQYYSK